ncbi:MAG: GntR family transcriptional regulator [Ferruginibacter sp.]|nr:GntR family transcriptional regulator [Ferruginibacter sp.]
MKKLEIIDLIKVDEYSITSKYLQIANCVIREIENGHIHAGDNMPSINELSIELDIARDTVERGYKHLKHIGVIDSVPRRGYYIVNTEFRRPLKVFLLFNKLSEHKKTIYDSFFATLGEHAVIDFYIYNNDFLLFKRLLSNKRDDYTHYVIIPHFIEGGDNAAEVINSIPKDKLLLLDKMLPNVSGEYAAAYENFEKDIYNALSGAAEQLSKYNTIKIIFPAQSYYPPEILKGFKNFCQDFAFGYKVISDIADEPITEGEVYINVMEDDLITLIEKIMLTQLKIGEQVGIISYNEIPIKKIILNGITTISTDFHQMGKIAAELILSNSREHIEVPFRLTPRASL